MRTRTAAATDERQWLAWAALLVAVMGISWSAPFVRWAGVPGPASAFYRLLIAAAVLVPALLLQRPAARADAGSPARRAWTRRAVLLAFGGGAFFAIDIALFNTAVLRTRAATAVLLGNNAPVFVGLASWLILRRPQRLTFWAGLALALSGCAVMVVRDAAASDPRAHCDMTGDLLALTASAFFAAYLVTTERARGGMDTLTFSTVAVAGSVVTLLAVCLALDVPLRGYPLRAWAALAGLGLVSQLAAYFALVHALGHLPATVTSVALLAQVPVAALLAALLLGEPLSAAQIVGGALVLAGIYVVSRGR